MGGCVGQRAMALFSEIERDSADPLGMYRSLLFYAVQQLNFCSVEKEELRKGAIAIHNSNEKSKRRIHHLESYIGRLFKYMQDKTERCCVGEEKTKVSSELMSSRQDITQQSQSLTIDGGNCSVAEAHDVADCDVVMVQHVQTGGYYHACSRLPSRGNGKGRVVNDIPIGRVSSHLPVVVPCSSSKDRTSVNASSSGSMSTRAPSPLSEEENYFVPRDHSLPRNDEKVVDKILFDIFMLIHAEEEMRIDAVATTEKYHVSERTTYLCEDIFTSICRLREEVDSLKQRNKRLTEIIRQKESVRLLATATAEQQATAHMLTGKRSEVGDEHRLYLSASKMEPSTRGEGSDEEREECMGMQEVCADTTVIPAAEANDGKDPESGSEVFQPGGAAALDAAAASGEHSGDEVDGSVDVDDFDEEFLEYNTWKHSFLSH